MKNKKGISLIYLVITIVIILILTSAAIIFLGGENGVVQDAKKARLMDELRLYKEQLEYFNACQELEDSDYNHKTLNAGKNSIFYNTQKAGETGNILDALPNLSDEFYEMMEIIKGELLINTKDKNIIEIAQLVDIDVNPYDIVNGELLSSNGNLLLVDENGSLTIPDSVIKIGVGAFANLEGLKTIIIPGTCKEIATNAFSYNKTLEKVIMQDGVEKIGNNAFSFCSQLKEVEMPDSVTLIDSQAFYSCSSLESIELSKNITTLSSNVLSSCSKLKEIVIPNGVKSLQGSCLSGSAIVKIDIPASVTSIASGAFTNCNQLTQINLASNDYYFFSDGALCNKDGTSIIFMTTAKLKESDTFSIPEGIKSFSYALQNYTNIKKLVIPSTLKTLTLSQGSHLPITINEIEVVSGNETFISEDNILYTKNDKRVICCFSKDKNVVVKEGMKLFGSVAFKTAPNAEVITLPESATTLEYMTFLAASQKLKNIIIGKNVTSIDPMFKYQHYIGNVTIDAENPNYMIEDTVIYTKDKKQLVTVIKKISGTFVIPNGVEVIQKQAFHAQSGMKGVTIPNTLKEIVSSFGYCSGLTTITIPSSVTKIGSGCFANCSNLSQIIINKPKNSITGAPWGATKGNKVITWNG